MPIKGGVKEAAKMLSGLDPESRSKVLEKIANEDPKMAELLKKNMVIFEDLKFLSIKMLPEFLKEVEVSDLAKGLRMGSDELKDFFLLNLPKRIAKDISEVLNGPPLAKREVLDSIEKIMTIVRAKIDKGELVLKTNDTDEYV